MPVARGRLLFLDRQSHCWDGYQPLSLPLSFFEFQFGISGSLAFMVPRGLPPPLPLPLPLSLSSACLGADRVFCVFHGGVGRPGTPATPGAADRTASPLPPSAAPDESGTNFEASIVQSVEIDLGDF